MDGLLLVLGLIVLIINLSFGFILIYGLIDEKNLKIKVLNDKLVFKNSKNGSIYELMIDDITNFSCFYDRKGINRIVIKDNKDKFVIRLLPDEDLRLILNTIKRGKKK